MKKITLTLFLVTMAFLIGTGHSQDRRSGERIYTTLCWNCHGIKGISEIPGAIPSFAKGERLHKPDDILFKSIWNGTRQKGQLRMAAWKEWLTENEVREVIYYIRNLPNDVENPVTLVNQNGE